MTTAYKFSQHVRIADQNFPVGIHQVTEAIESHPDFLHFVRCGYIEDAPAAKVAAQPVAINEMQKRMAKRIEQKLAANKAKIKKASEPVREPVQVETPTADQDEESESGQDFEPVSETDAEQVPEGDHGDEESEEDLTPQQKAARTRAAKKAAKEE